MPISSAQVDIIIELAMAAICRSLGTGLPTTSRASQCSSYFGAIRLRAEVGSSTVEALRSQSIARNTLNTNIRHENVSNAHVSTAQIHEV
ncbi:hypothetical protein HBI56_060420 [Parastagonospora nodorum]|nr:hypothetical protein HBH51_096910 [Parastagonospora nodorum]KAH4036238.1 hypothetical protein HBI09_084460 [Parastagonospora nodorum]KAH4050423.1 hypothetical protein HBH49_132290 [Parastagonospora nodorum]KAH4118968.1 hypothetical protein HBH47_132570 [Parastagonospora nodorum]KAH4164048.1 hypothetical protein HBH43_150220 [Parastagonospora nodorum]